MVFSNTDSMVMNLSKLRNSEGQGHLLLLLLSSFSRVRLCATPQMAAH